LAEEYVQTNSSPSITEIIFSTEIDENNNPININDAFPSGTTNVNVFTTYLGMTDGVPAEAVFKYDDEELVSTPFNWSAGESGTRFFDGISYTDGSPLNAGSCKWELYYDSTLLASREFNVQ
jgi:hypothetical protein